MTRMTQSISPNILWTRGVQLLATALAVSVVSACTSAPEFIERQAMAAAPAFQANALFVLSDADMAATAYADRLVHKIPGQRDALTRLLPAAPENRVPPSVFASNSVTGWPTPMDIGPGCRFAYVAETKGEVATTVTKLDDPYTGWPEGKLISAFDVSGAGAPVPAESIEVGANPKSVHVSPDGRWLVAPVEKVGAELAFVILEHGRPKQVRTAKFDTVAYDKVAFVRGPQFARINPRGDVIALNVGNTHVAFVKVIFDAAGLPAGVEPIGEPVPAGDWISMGRWSADGRFYITADTGWGPKDMDFIFNGPGAIRSIAFAADGAHRVASMARVSLSSEGFGVDPAGTLLAVVNMERTPFPDTLPFSLFTRRTAASISLVTFNPANGALATVDGPVAFNGVLPEYALFDRDGTGVAVAVFHESAQEPKAGWVEYFHVDRSGATPRIVPTGRRQAVTRGSHYLAACY